MRFELNQLQRCKAWVFGLLVDKINVSGTIADEQIETLKNYQSRELVLSGLRSITDNQIDSLSEIPSLNLKQWPGS